MASIWKLVAYSTSGAAETTVDFLADAAYRVSAWSPAVARRRAGELGGRGPYEDVTEELIITIGGATAMTKLRSLVGLLEQATRLGRGEPVGAVLFHYKATASSPELRAVVVGGDVELPRNYSLAAATQMIDPAVLRLVRSGLWYGDEATATDTTAGNPEVAVASGLTALSAAAPIKIEITGLEGTKSIVSESFVLVTSHKTASGAASRMLLIAAENLAGGDFTSVADSTNKARGNVLRFTPGAGSAGAWHMTSVPSMATADSSARRWGVFINFRNNSATNSFIVRALLWHSYNAAARNAAETPGLFVPAGVSSPQWAFIGSAALPDNLLRVSLDVYSELGSGTLDIDDIVVMALDHPDNDRAIALTQWAGSVISLPADLVIDPRPLAERVPAVYVLENGTAEWWPYRGDAALHMRPGATAVAVAWLATGYSSSLYWRVTDAAQVVQTPGVRVTRTNAYLVLE